MTGQWRPITHNDVPAWNALLATAEKLDATGEHYNEGDYGAESTMTAIMGRESAYSGQMITWDMIMASKQDLMPKAFGYKESMGPVELPEPGKYKFI